jgi:alpha-galactosidase
MVRSSAVRDFTPRLPTQKPILASPGMTAKQRILRFLPFLILLFSLSAIGESQPVQCMDSANLVVAAAINREITVNAAHPAKEWHNATAVTFCADWQGKNPDPRRQTTVRVLWSPQTLYLRYQCRYSELYLFSDSDSNGRRDHLWDRDVAEAFLQPDPSKPRYYKEFEVAPNGFWIDLDISPEPLRDLKSGLRHSVWLNQRKHVWAAELAIPLKALVDHFDPAAEWRANFYRIEGQKEPRFYSAWRPTYSPQPNFHVPSAFGRLRFAPAH